MSMSESIVLDIRDLKSHFFTAKGEIPAVDGVSIEVPAGKITGPTCCLVFTSTPPLIAYNRHLARFARAPKN